MSMNVPANVPAPPLNNLFELEYSAAFAISVPMLVGIFTQARRRSFLPASMSSLSFLLFSGTYALEQLQRGGNQESIREMPSSVRDVDGEGLSAGKVVAGTTSEIETGARAQTEIQTTQTDAANPRTDERQKPDENLLEEKSLGADTTSSGSGADKVAINPGLRGTSRKIGLAVTLKQDTPTDGWMGGQKVGGREKRMWTHGHTHMEPCPIRWVKCSGGYPSLPAGHPCDGLVTPCQRHVGSGNRTFLWPGCEVVIPLGRASCTRALCMCDSNGFPVLHRGRARQAPPRSEKLQFHGRWML